MTMMLILVGYLLIGFILVVAADRTKSDVSFYEILVGWPVIMAVVLIGYVVSFVEDWINRGIR